MALGLIFEVAQGRRDMRGEGAGGANGFIKRRQRHRLGKPWRKIRKKIGGGDGEIGSYSRGRGETVGGDKRGVGDAGMEMGGAQVDE